jgi:hypothetical protein
MYAVELDRSKRLLVISAAAVVTAEQAEMAVKQVRDLLRDIAPGFHAFADFRWLESMDPAAVRHIAQIMDALAEKNVASVTRVMPDPHKDIGLNILSQFHYGTDVKIATFETLADALQDIATKLDFSPG